MVPDGPDGSFQSRPAGAAPARRRPAGVDGVLDTVAVAVLAVLVLAVAGVVAVVVGAVSCSTPGALAPRSRLTRPPRDLLSLVG
jgi:hypothetical protein